jgi:hypothetical protein
MNTDPLTFNKYLVHLDAIIDEIFPSDDAIVATGDIQRVDEAEAGLDKNRKNNQLMMNKMLVNDEQRRAVLLKAPGAAPGAAAAATAAGGGFDLKETIVNLKKKYRIKKVSPLPIDRYSIFIEKVQAVFDNYTTFQANNEDMKLFIETVRSEINIKNKLKKFETAWKKLAKKSTLQQGGITIIEAYESLHANIILNQKGLKILEQIFGDTYVDGNLLLEKYMIDPVINEILVEMNEFTDMYDSIINLEDTLNGTDVGKYLNMYSFLPKNSIISNLFIPLFDKIISTRNNDDLFGNYMVSQVLKMNNIYVPNEPFSDEKKKFFEAMSAYIQEIIDLKIEIGKWIGKETFTLDNYKNELLILQYYFKSPNDPNKSHTFVLNKGVYDIDLSRQLNSRYILRVILKNIVSIIRHIEAHGNKSEDNNQVYSNITGTIVGTKPNLKTDREKTQTYSYFPLSVHSKFLSKIYTLVLRLEIPTIQSPSVNTSTNVSREPPVVQEQQQEDHRIEESKFYFSPRGIDEIKKIKNIEDDPKDRIRRGIEKKYLILLYDYYVRLHKLQNPIEDLFIHFWAKVAEKNITKHINFVKNDNHSAYIESEFDAYGNQNRVGIWTKKDSDGYARGIEYFKLHDNPSYPVVDGHIDFIDPKFILNIIDNILCERIYEDMIQGLEYVYIILKTLKLDIKGYTSMVFYISRNIPLITGITEPNYDPEQQNYDRFVVASSHRVDKQTLHEALKYLRVVVGNQLRIINKY